MQRRSWCIFFSTTWQGLLVRTAKCLSRVMGELPALLLLPFGCWQCWPRSACCWAKSCRFSDFSKPSTNTLYENRTISCLTKAQFQNKNVYFYKHVATRPHVTIWFRSLGWQWDVNSGTGNNHCHFSKSHFDCLSPVTTMKELQVTILSLWWHFLIYRTEPWPPNYHLDSENNLFL